MHTWTLPACKCTGSEWGSKATWVHVHLLAPSPASSRTLVGFGAKASQLYFIDVGVAINTQTRQSPVGGTVTMSAKYAFSKTLKEVRFLFCQGENSAATRTFLTRAYPTMKKNNPHTPILMREAAGTIPKIYARYEFGKEKSQSLEGLDDKQIEDAVSTLVKSDV
ncbi:hypothetical protein RRF57_012594 [Xylaria bambusicola]|uniref:Ribosomal protein/NADH dehydrogenase domain-containing protein n=1 Tax=Xylaria bambusicola TaxID=326684 RepID=A0AAN7UVF8_9PEZI